MTVKQFALHVRILRLLPTKNVDVNAFGRISLSVCLRMCLSICPVRTLTIESLGLETSLVVCRYIIRISS